MKTLGRLAFLTAVIPPRLLIHWLDRRKAGNGVAPLGAFLRGVVYVSTWLLEISLLASMF